MRIQNLIMALLTGLIMMVAGCATIDQTSLAKNPVGVKSTQILTTDKDTYNLDEKIKVSFFNSPGNDSDWICVVPAGSPDNEAGDYKYMPKRLDQGSLLFDPPSPGKYEARAYYNYGRNGFVVSGRHPFSVAAAKGIAAAAAQPVKAVRDDYMLFQTVTLGDKNKPLTGFSTSGSLAVLKTPNDNMIDYELWTRGQDSSDSNKKSKDSVYGPVKFSRNPATEGVSFSTKGFGLAEDVVNQIMNQVEKNSRMEGRWDQEISLKLLGAHLPRQLAFHFDVQKIELKPGVWALLVQTYTDVFTIEILPSAANVNNGVFSGVYKSVLIYSPEDHRLYQMASSFDAGKGDETLQIQETAFLTGLDGKPVFPLLDMRKILDLKKQDRPDPLVTMPLWVFQAMKVNQVVRLASSTTAERTSNHSTIWSAAINLIEDEAFSAVDSAITDQIKTYTKQVVGGGNKGELVDRYFSVMSSTQTIIATVPVVAGAVLFGGPPIAATLAGVATVSSLYELYTTLSDIGTINQLLETENTIVHRNFFGGQNCGRECFAQANAAYNFKEPYVQPTEPGPIPEPPAAPTVSGRPGWVLPTAIAGGAAIAAGVALGLSGGSSSTSSTSSTDSCNYSGRCCVTSGGIQTVVIYIIASCDCPNDANYIGMSGQYKACDCKNC